MVIDLLLYTHSSCGDVLSIFLSQLTRNTKNLSTCRVVLLSDDQESAEKLLQRSGIENFVVVQYEDSSDYSKHFDSLEGVLGEFFLYMQEDFFITSGWDYAMLNQYVSLMENLGLSLIRLTPSGSYRTKAYLESFLRTSKFLIEGEKFRRIDYLSSLPACMQPTIWRTSIFLEMHDEVKVENLRDEWSNRYKLHFKKYGLVGLSTDKVEIPYLEVTAVRKGKWNFTDFKWGLILQEILKNHGVNPLDRGIATYKFQVLEKRPGLLKDLWRRVRYERY